MQGHAENYVPAMPTDCCGSADNRNEVLTSDETNCCYRSLLRFFSIVDRSVSSYCSWRRSSPSWPSLFVEVVFGSAGAAYCFAREDGHEEAKQLEANLTALEGSLGPFFRGVQACMRMVRCSQTLSFGLRLSVPMPPVARMEGRLGSNGPVGEEVALRELRSVVLDALQGGTELVNAFQSGTSAVDCNTRAPAAGEGQVFDSTGNCQTAQLLDGLAREEKQLAGDLRRFLAEGASRIDGGMKEPGICGLWWESQVKDLSEAVMKLAAYFEAAAER